MDEFRQALLNTQRPSDFFSSPTQELAAAFRELYALKGVPQSPKYHPEGDAFVHTMLVIDEAAAVRSMARRPLDFMLAALTHDLGKKIATGRKENGDWHSIGHETKGIPLVRALLERLGEQEDTILYCENLCRLHMRVHTCFYGKAGTAATNRLFGECVCPEDLALLCICDTRGTGKPEGASDEEERYIQERLALYLQKKNSAG